MNLFDIIFYLNFDFEVILHRCRRLKDRRNHGPADSAMISSPPYTAEYRLTDKEYYLAGIIVKMNIFYIKIYKSIIK